jgi:hypothetical protein
MNNGNGDPSIKYFENLQEQVHEQAERASLSMDFIQNLCEEFQKNNRIDPASYENLDVKRGLRNADGTGVMVESPASAMSAATICRTVSGCLWRASSSIGALT